MTVSSGGASTHDAIIADQFTRQAAQFATSAMHHNQAALDLLVNAAHPRREDVTLDVACGPGSPVGDDRAGLRAMIEAAVDGDAMGVGARREGGTVRFDYPTVVVVAVKDM